jgi:hypothetical protein
MHETHSSNGVTINQRFLEIARDPRIIPGVHHYCDEWCDYCALTARCLGFRCTKEHRRAHGRVATDPTFRSMEEAVQFTRELCAIEGVPTDELEMLLAGGQAAASLQTTHPLAGLAWEYAIRAAQLLETAPAPAPATGPVRASPPPHEVVLWFHVRMYFRITRALVGQAHTEQGTLDRREDANGCAKLTLVAVERSRAALRALAGSTDEPGIRSLVALLDEIERNIDEQFPEARRFVRLGLDVPVA